MFSSVWSHCQRAAEVLRAEGMRSLWFKILGETVYRRLLIVEKKIAPVPRSHLGGALLECRPMTAHDIDEYLDLRPDAGLDTTLERLAKGHVCLVVSDGKMLVHSCWSCTDRAEIEYLGAGVKLASDSVYVYEVFTRPESRGQSISAVRSNEMERYYDARGYRRLVGAVWSENRPVSRSADKAGYSVVGRIGYWQIGKRKRLFCNYIGTSPPLWLDSG